MFSIRLLLTIWPISLAPLKKGSDAFGAECSDAVGAEAINAFPQKRQYTAIEASIRSCSRQYNLKVADIQAPVSKKAFASALGVTFGHIDNALKSSTPCTTWGIAASWPWKAR